MTRATGWNGRGWKEKETKERKILRYAQNDNSNAVSAKELHNFPYLCKTPPKNQNTKPKDPTIPPKKQKPKRPSPPPKTKPKPTQNQTQTKLKPKTKAQSSNPKRSKSQNTPQKNEKTKTLKHI